MSQVKFAKVMDVAGINAAIKSIQGRGVKLDSDIQITGLAILGHIEKHREVSLFTKLFNAMPAGSRRNALVKWALSHGQVAVNKDKKSSKETPFLFNKEAKTDLAGAETHPWFNYKPEASPRDAFNLDVAIIKFQEMLKAKIKAGAIDQHDRRVEILLAVTPEVVADAEPSESANDAEPVVTVADQLNVA